MTEGLDLLLADHDQPGAVALGSRLYEFMRAQYGEGRFVRQERIKSQVYRLHFELERKPLVFIIKCLEARIARRTELVARRWLPAVGLAQAGPPLLATIGTPDGESVWQLYSDLGSRSLAENMNNAESVAGTVRFIAELHQRFIGHPYLPEFRLFGGDLGAHFVESNLRDAMLTLETIQKHPNTSADNWTVVDRLLDRISAINDELPSRLRILKEFSGPETLLHGDLWPSNVFVSSEGQVRLIDWDRTAAGPIAYDISTFILRFPPERRVELMELYREAVHPSVWEIPAYKDLNILFETFEFARDACLISWPAIALWERNAAWALDQLEEIERWFRDWEAVFPSIEDSI
jgi:Phosphotransferase enzyme family